MTMISVGITGGIGSGKTTVCNIWQSLGAYILNADVLAKQIMMEDEDVISEIKLTFGPESYFDDGSLNREFLAKEAFQKGRIQQLNAIVHPRIPGKSTEIMEKARGGGYEVFVYEAALLFENPEPGFLDYVVLVLADQKQRVERVRKRDKVDEKKVRERMSKQQDFNKMTHRADFVIYNNGTLEELEERSKELYKKILEQDKTS